MTEPIHPASSGDLPWFVTAFGETDVLMVVMALFLVVFVLLIGVLYFRLHALPDRFAHNKVQFEIVCVLGLLAMFTHMHIFWIAGLLVALIDFPDLPVHSNELPDQRRRSRVRNGDPQVISRDSLCGLMASPST